MGPRSALDPTDPSDKNLMGIYLISLLFTTTSTNPSAPIPPRSDYFMATPRHLPCWTRQARAARAARLSLSPRASPFAGVAGTPLAAPKDSHAQEPSGLTPPRSYHSIATPRLSPCWALQARAARAARLSSRTTIGRRSRHVAHGSRRHVPHVAGSRSVHPETEARANAVRLWQLVDKEGEEACLFGGGALRRGGGVGVVGDADLRRHALHDDRRRSQIEAEVLLQMFDQRRKRDEQL